MCFTIWRTKGSHMVARIATYSFTGDAQELGKRAEAGILPILKATRPTETRLDHVVLSKG